MVGRGHRQSRITMLQSYVLYTISQRMSYNQLRRTISIKNDSICDICLTQIKKGQEIFIIPGKYIAHIKCHLKKEVYINDKT